jgi:hypothetical protein
VTTKFNSVWVSSAARTGSMWTTNVVREIFLSAHYDIFPKNQIQSDLEWLNLYKSEAEIDQNDKNRYVLKIHSGLPSVPNYLKIITNIRNPYDICASFHEFMKCDVNSSIDSVLKLSTFVNHYKKFSNDILIIRYEEIEDHPKMLINKLALFCNTKLSKIQIKNICIKYNKKNVVKLIKKNDENLKQTIHLNQKIDQQKIVNFNNGNYRSFDLDTGFQSGHISSRKTGEWKKVFSNEEAKDIIEKIDSLAIELGYASEKN